MKTILLAATAALVLPISSRAYTASEIVANSAQGVEVIYDYASDGSLNSFPLTVDSDISFSSSGNSLTVNGFLAGWFPEIPKGISLTGTVSGNKFTVSTTAYKFYGFTQSGITTFYCIQLYKSSSKSMFLKPADTNLEFTITKSADGTKFIFTTPSTVINIITAGGQLGTARNPTYQATALYGSGGIQLQTQPVNASVTDTCTYDLENFEERNYNVNFKFNGELEFTVENFNKVPICYAVGWDNNLGYIPELFSCRGELYPEQLMFDIKPTYVGHYWENGEVFDLCITGQDYFSSPGFEDAYSIIGNIQPISVEHKGNRTVVTDYKLDIGFDVDEEEGTDNYIYTVVPGYDPVFSVTGEMTIEFNDGVALPEIDHTHEVTVENEHFGYGRISSSNPDTYIYLSGAISPQKNHGFVDFDNYALYLVPEDNVEAIPTRINLEKYHSAFRPSAADLLRTMADTPSAADLNDGLAYNLLIPENELESKSAAGKYAIVVGTNYKPEWNLEETRAEATPLGNATTGIDDIVADDLSAAEDTPRYFNLQGIEVAEPIPGQIYILRQGTKSTKIIR